MTYERLAAELADRYRLETPTFETGPWPSPLRWSPDGKFLYLQFNGATYAIPWNGGRVLRSIPEHGLRTDKEVAALPGARRIGNAEVFAGPDPSAYVFLKQSMQRNIYRIPVSP